MDYFDSQVVHHTPDGQPPSNSKRTPIYQTTAFTFTDLDDLESFYTSRRDEQKYLYSRYGNPNTDELGHGVAMLEGAPSGVATSSGLSAILAGVLAVCRNGDHLIACEDLYGGTYQLFAEELKNFGIETTFVSFVDMPAIEEVIRPNTRLLYSETITNPLLRVENLNKMVQIARKHNLLTMVDNTFATPFLVRPYEHGVDLVAHSITKYISGHSDVTAGIVAGRKEYIQKARDRVVRLGLNLGPFDGWLAVRGLKTLSIRMERQVQNAAYLARYLRTETDVKKVYYPEEVSEKGNGAIVTVALGSQYDVSKFFRHLGWVKIVATLAGVETTVSYPAGTSHRNFSKELRKKLGIGNDVVRISVGIEDYRDIVAAFSRALQNAKRKK